MRAVNTAYDALKGFSGDVSHNADDYGDALNRMINIALGIQTQSGGVINVGKQVPCNLVTLSTLSDQA